MTDKQWFTKSSTEHKNHSFRKPDAKNISRKSGFNITKVNVFVKFERADRICAGHGPIGYNKRLYA